MIRKLLFLLGLVVSIPTLASAADIEVCPIGCAFNQLQPAVDAWKPGDRIFVLNGVYRHPASSSTTPLARLNKANLQVYCDAGAWFMGRRTVADNATGSKLTSSGVGSDRAPVIEITANDVLFEGCEVSHSNTAGIVVSGNRAIVRGNRVWGNWLTGIGVRAGTDTIVEWNETLLNLHGTGIGGGAPNKSGLTTRTDNLTVRFNLTHDNGFYLDSNGQLRAVPAISGDPAGGGNSDGFGSSKSCAKNTPGTNRCTGWKGIGNLAFRNHDDGQDHSATNYELISNVGYCNGPSGGRAIKVLNPTSGNRWIGNAAFSFSSCAPSTKNHGIEVSCSSSGCVASDNRSFGYSGSKGIILGTGVTGTGNVQAPACTVNLDAPAGRPWVRMATLYQRFKVCATNLQNLPVYPGRP